MKWWRKRNVRWGLAAVLALLLTAVCAAALATDMSLSNNTYFKDETFRTYLKNFDKDQNGFLSDSERLDIHGIECGYQNITSVEGIEYFQELESLNCEGNPIKKIDVSKNTILRSLYFSNCNVSELNLGSIRSLENLYCEHNQLKTVDLSHCTSMQRLYLTDNKLTTLTVSHMPHLLDLGCGYNKLGKVDVTHNEELQMLFVYSCGLSSLNVTANPVLETLSCEKNSLKSLDLSKNSGLFYLNCYSNKITALNLAPCSREINNLVQNETPVLWGDTVAKWGDGRVSEPGLYVDYTVKVTTKKGVWPNITAVKLNKTTARLTRTSKNLKPTLQLKASVVPATIAHLSFTWTSSKPKVATVNSSGKVTALKAGKVTITCTEKTSGKKATCTLTITDRRVKKITLNKKMATMKVGKKLQLKVKFSPADAVYQQVKWSSSNKKVATVNGKGKVTAKKAGTCVITCVALDGNKKAACKITVK